MGLSGATIGTYRPQYRPLSAIRYLDVNPLPTRYTLFITLVVTEPDLRQDALSTHFGVRRPRRAWVAPPYSISNRT
jgi:hypothetical protein